MPRHNLPAPLSQFIGREDELADVACLLGTHRLVTLTGPPGTGKTRLAVELARRCLSQYRDGVWLVPLAPVRDPALVVGTIAGVLNVREKSGVSPLEALRSHFGLRQALLVLDNWEHLLVAAPLVTDLLSACPELRILATSRAVLHLSAECVARVRPLRRPEVGHVSAAGIAQIESVALFVDRAQAARPDFALTDANAASVAAICRRLDGLPLALELAAAQLRLLSPQALAGQLDARGMGTLAKGPRDAPEHQQSLQATVAWSLTLLPRGAQETLSRLAPFAGGCWLSSALVVCRTGDQSDIDLLANLATLVDHSLVRREETPEGEVRLALLETVREEASRRLAANTNELDAVRRQHAAHFVELAEAAEGQLEGREAEAWLARLDVDHDNIRVALEWLVEHGSPDQAVKLAAAMGSYWRLRGLYAEARRWLERVLILASSAPALRAKALVAAGMISREQADFQSARRDLNESLAIARAEHDQHGQAVALHQLGLVAFAQGDWPLLIELTTPAVDLYLACGDRVGAARCQTNLGLAALAAGDHTRARAAFSDALAVFRSTDNLRAAATVETNIGATAYMEDDMPTARAHYEAGLRLAHGGYRLVDAMFLDRLGHVAVRERNFAEAHQLLQQSLEWRLELGSPQELIESLHSIGTLAAAEGQFSVAARLLLAADALGWTSLQTPGEQLYAADHAAAIHATRRGLGQDRFSAESVRGRTLPLEAAVAEARAAVRAEAEPPPAGAPRTANSLTHRELAVLELVVKGASNKEIALSLSISPRTAERHLANLYAKLGVRSRAEAIAHALGSGLRTRSPTG